MSNIFVFDLDNTVVEPISYKKENLFKDIDKDLGSDFRESMTMEAVGYPHMLYPGFLALFRWIYNRGDLIYFFSTGIKERNVEIVPKLIKKAFGDTSEEVLKNVKIFSREDCIDTTNMGDKKDIYQPKYFFGNYKKKLEEKVVPLEDMHKIVLIDDDSSYMVKGEEKNFLKVPMSLKYYYPSYRRDLFFAFHKAFYIRALLEKIISISERDHLSLIEASWTLVKDKEERPLHDERDYTLYSSGLKMLQEIDPKLKFYFPLDSD